MTSFAFSSSSTYTLLFLSVLSLLLALDRLDLLPLPPPPLDPPVSHSLYAAVVLNNTSLKRRLSFSSLSLPLKFRRRS
jgi:hypothetical protein